MARRSKDEAEETRENIINAAIRLFLRDGVSRTTLEKIAAEAGYTRGAVYHHFENKSKLLYELHRMIKPPAEELSCRFSRFDSDDPLKDVEDSILCALDEMMSDPRRRDIDAIFFHNCEFVDRVNPIVESERTHLSTVSNMIKEAFQKALEKGLIRSDIDIDNLARSLLCYCYGIFAMAARQRLSGDDLWLQDYRSSFRVIFDGLRHGAKSGVV